MAALTNIKMTGFSQCNEIKIGSVDIAKAYLGSTLIWEKATSESYYSITPVNGVIAFSFTPTSNVNLTSITQYLNTTENWGIVLCVYTLSGSVATKIYSETGSSNTTIDAANPIVVSSTNYYKYTKTLATPLALTAGTTYYLLLWQRYISAKTIGITGNTSGSYIDMYEWECTNATVNTVTKTTGATIKAGETTS